MDRSGQEFGRRMAEIIDIAKELGAAASAQVIFAHRRGKRAFAQFEEIERKQTALLIAAVVRLVDGEGS